MSDPLFINVSAGAPEYNARELRRGLAALTSPHGTDRFGARAGVRPGAGDAVTLSGTTWTVEHTTAVIYPGLTDLAGPYLVGLPSESGSLDPADGSSDRIDALDLQVQDDDEDASGFRRAHVVYVAGTPAPSPSEPALTATSLRLATTLVPAGGALAPSILSLPLWTVAAGGILPLRDDSEYPTGYDGLTVWRVDQGWHEVWHGGAWQVRAPVVADRAWRASALSIPNTTWTEVPMDAGDFIGHFTVPTSGTYRVTALASWFTEAIGERTAMLTRNGTDRGTDALDGTQVLTTAVNGFPTAVALPAYVDRFNVGDTIHMIEWQNSGGSLDTDTNPSSRPTLTVEFVGGS